VPPTDSRADFSAAVSLAELEALDESLEVVESALLVSVDDLVSVDFVSAVLLFDFDVSGAVDFGAFLVLASLIPIARQYFSGPLGAGPDGGRKKAARPHWRADAVTGWI
jgi:hypothetical protein